jgi:hypothetical protein
MSFQFLIRDFVGWKYQRSEDSSFSFQDVNVYQFCTDPLYTTSNIDDLGFNFQVHGCGLEPIQTEYRPSIFSPLFSYLASYPLFKAEFLMQNC